MDENWECVAFSVCRCACDTCANANGQEHTQHVSLRVPVEHPKKIHTNWYDLLCQRENSQRLCATATCYLDKLLRKRWNSTTSTRRFVCKRFQHVRKKSTESFKSPLNFVSRCKLLGLIRSNSTETNPWTWMTFSEKKHRFESMCGSWNHTCTICSPAAFQIWNGTRLVSFLYRQLRALWSTGIKCSEGFRVWTI